MRKLLGLCAAFAAFTSVAAAADDDTRTLRLAAELAVEGRHESAAIEYRRLALAARDADSRAAYWWAAGCAYARARQWGTANAMLDRAEQETSAIRIPAVLLRVDAAIGSGDLQQARFYLDGLAGSPLGRFTNDWVCGRAAGIAVREGKLQAAHESLTGMSRSDNRDRALTALTQYERGRNRIPAIGGVLGLVPGLGYAYSGEYANAMRSLLLNSLFMWGMAETSHERHWGAFAVISFFEITWYSGSIYGGIDAAHRFNRRRLDACVNDVDIDPPPEPDWNALPVVSLRFGFR